MSRSHAAAEYQVVRPDLFFWQSYEPAVKTDLCCCAIAADEGLLFFDPIPLAAAAEEELIAGRKPRAIVLTNSNHERAAIALARRLEIDIWARAEAKGEVAATRWFDGKEKLFGNVQAIPLEGFVPGETAFLHEETLILGDAIINLPPYGFSMLPDKYCIDPRRGREELKRLIPFQVEVLTFAHGLPIVEHARERLHRLIGETARP